MAYIIKEESCTNCGNCDDQCPTEAISEKNNKRWIDPDKCVDCSACESSCAEGAISAG